jgi:hypothetical protein
LGVNQQAAPEASLADIIEDARKRRPDGDPPTLAEVLRR